MINPSVFSYKTKIVIQSAIIRKINVNIFSGLFIIISCINIYAKPERITNENAPFIYEINTEIPTPQETLAGFISQDYRNASDEFTARELFEKIKPVVDKRISETKSTTDWMVLTRIRLPEYDFNKNGFPSDLDSETFFPFDNNYALMLTNTSDFQIIPVPLEEAKSFAGTLKQSRNVTMQVEGRPVRSIEKRLNYRDSKVIMLEIEKITLKFENGTIIGTKTK